MIPGKIKRKQSILFLHSLHLVSRDGGNSGYSTGDPPEYTARQYDLKKYVFIMSSQKAKFTEGHIKYKKGEFTVCQ